jgi:hypothetical protein
MVDCVGPGPPDPESDGDGASASRDGPTPKRCNPNDAKSIKAFLLKFEAYLDDRELLDMIIRGLPTFESVVIRNPHLDMSDAHDKDALSDILKAELTLYAKTNRKVYNKLVILVDLDKSQKYTEFCERQSAERDGREFLLKLRKEVTNDAPRCC